MRCPGTIHTPSQRALRCYASDQLPGNALSSSFCFSAHGTHQIVLQKRRIVHSDGPSFNDQDVVKVPPGCECAEEDTEIEVELDGGFLKASMGASERQAMEAASFAASCYVVLDPARQLADTRCTELESTP